MKAHWIETQASISPTELNDEGVYYAQHAPQQDVFRSPLDALKHDRGYIEEDIVELSPNTPKLDEICAKFVDEHHHDDDEVRFVLSGEGIFDIRSRGDQWMRVQVEAGDLIVVPAMRHHRFFLTDTKAIRCVRLFKDAEGWVPHYR